MLNIFVTFTQTLYCVTQLFPISCAYLSCSNPRILSTSAHICRICLSLHLMLSHEAMELQQKTGMLNIFVPLLKHPYCVTQLFPISCAYLSCNNPRILSTSARICLVCFNLPLMVSREGAVSSSSCSDKPDVAVIE